MASPNNKAMCLRSRPLLHCLHRHPAPHLLHCLHRHLARARQGDGRLLLRLLHPVDGSCSLLCQLALQSLRITGQAAASWSGAGHAAPPQP
jgi:hypothetical protein